jgi:hypothetical protein
MMRLVLAGGIVLAPLCATAQGVIECKAELPVARTGYWSWRNIDGKQCWYPGRPGMDKARLQWPRSTHLPDPNWSESDRRLLESYWPNLPELMLDLRSGTAPKD